MLGHVRDFIETCKTHVEDLLDIVRDLLDPC
jgi:hypothetical protein